VVFLGKIGVGIAKERLLESQFASYDVVFLLLDPEDEYEGDVEELPVEHCLTVRFRGSHKEASARYERLMAYVREHQLQISGFSKEITIIDNGLTDDTDKFVTEIQIPVLPAEKEE
jgi:effector-binding domain-containing protein